MNITAHGLQRVKQRLHVSKEYAYKIIIKAYNFGIHQRDVKNRSIKKYLDSTVQDDYFGVLYCRHLFIFSKDSNTMITVLRIPEKYISILHSENPNNNKRRKIKDDKGQYNKNKRISEEEF